MDKVLYSDYLVLVLILLVSFLTYTHARACGDNPLEVVNNYSHVKGINSQELMAFLQENEPDDYRRLTQHYEVYLRCTSMIHNGYYKRSIDEGLASNGIELSSLSTFSKPTRPTSMFDLFDQPPDKTNSAGDNELSDDFWPSKEINIEDIPSNNNRNIDAGYVVTKPKKRYTITSIFKKDDVKIQ